MNWERCLDGCTGLGTDVDWVEGLHRFREPIDWLFVPFVAFCGFFFALCQRSSCSILTSSPTANSKCRLGRFKPVGGMACRFSLTG